MVTESRWPQCLWTLNKETQQIRHVIAVLNNRWADSLSGISSKHLWMTHYQKWNSFSIMAGLTYNFIFLEWFQIHCKMSSSFWCCESHWLPLYLHDHKTHPDSIWFLVTQWGCQVTHRDTGPGRSMTYSQSIQSAMTLPSHVSHVHVQGRTNLILQQCYQVLLY